jgi:hypothetical protein
MKEPRRSGVAYAVVELMGRVFMNATNDPFHAADALLAGIKAKVILVDFHAEATSEKVAMGWYLDGRVTAVLGTHTHIPTADERVLPGGTAFQTDVGMSGPYDSIIGVEKDLVLHKFLTGMPGKFEAAKGNPKMCAALVTCDPSKPGAPLPFSASCWGSNRREHSGLVVSASVVRHVADSAGHGPAWQRSRTRRNGATFSSPTGVCLAFISFPLRLKIMVHSISFGLADTSVNETSSPSWMGMVSSAGMAAGNFRLLVVLGQLRRHRMPSGQRGVAEAGLQPVGRS